jgi:hypothetical protein
VLLLLAAVLSVPAWQTATTPALRVADASPLVVRGVGFRPGERVKVVLLEPPAVTRATRATSRGRFTVRFAFSIGRCDDLDVRAVGRGGSRARLTLYAPDCTDP